MATRNVSVRLSTDGTGRVKADLEGLAQSGSQSLERLAGSARFATNAFVGLLSFHLVKSAAGALTGFVSDAVRAAGALAETADELGISVESLQRYQFAAEQIGVENERLEDAFRQLTRRIGEALAGNETMAKSFSQLGVSLLDAQGLTRGTEAVFRDLIERISQMASPTERAAALASIFGDRLGPRLANLLGQGIGEIDRFGKEAEDLGLILGDDVTRNADEVGDAIGSLGRVIGTAARTIVLDLLPSAEAIKGFARDVAAFFEEAIDGFRRFLGFDPDFDDTIDQIEEVEARVFELQGKVEARRAEALRLAREGSGGRLAQMLDTGAEERDLAEAEDKLNRLRARLVELSEERARLAVRGAPGAGLKPPPIRGDDEAAAKAAARATKELEDAERRRAAALRQLHEALDPVAAAGDRFGETMRLIGESGVSGAERVTLMAAAVGHWHQELDDASGATKRNEEAERKHQRLLKDGLEVYDKTRTATELYDAEFEHLTDLYRAGAIDAETFHRAVDNLGDGLEEGRDGVDELTRAFEGFGRRSAGSLADMLLGLDDVNASLDRFIQTLASDLVEQLIYKNITGPLADAASQVFKTSGAEGGLFSFIGGLFGFAQGGVFERGHLKAFAQGGVVTDPTIFPMADGLGLMGEKGPEAVMPLTRLQDGRLGVAATGGAAEVSVTLIDQRGSHAPPVQVRQRRGADGRREIEIVVRDIVDKLIGEGRLDRTMAGNYGLSRAPVMRG